jgi:hypothetical protein
MAQDLCVDYGPRTGRAFYSELHAQTTMSDLLFEETIAFLLGREFPAIIHFFDHSEIVDQWFLSATRDELPTSYFYVALTATGASVVDGKTPLHRLVVVNRMALAASVQRFARLIDGGSLDRIYGIADERYVIDTPKKLQDLFNTAICYRADLLAIDEGLFSVSMRDELLKESSALSFSAECRLISAQVVESLS